MSPVRKALGTGLRLGAAGLCGYLLYRNLRGVDLHALGRVLESVGWWGLALPIPFIASQAIDTVAWRRILAALGHAVSFRLLFPVRVAVEALGSSLPAGVVVAESLCPELLERESGIPKSATLASAGARRWLTMRAHAIYVALGAIAAFLTLPRDGAAWQRWAPWVVLASASLPLGASFALSLTLGTGTKVSGLWRWLARLPWPAFQRWVETKRASFAATDAGFAVLANTKAHFWWPTALLLASWLLESVESFFFMRVAGADLSFLQVLSFEAGLAVLRSAWFVAPAGLGAEDLGYLAVLRLLGVPSPMTAGAAFLVLKRGRELCWTALGYAWMLLRLPVRHLRSLRGKPLPPEDATHEGGATQGKERGDMSPETRHPG